MPQEPIKTALERHLLAELGDPALAAGMAGLVFDLTLDWTAPQIAPEQIRAIFAFTFGNRMQPNGNRSPGPVNAALADRTVELHRRTGAPVFAQWEIAEAIGPRLEPAKLVAINPGRDAWGEPVYLSTTGVLEAIARQTNAAALGPVGVIAFADHQSRCVSSARRLGFAAAAPEGIAMPRDYDPDSGQPWCRSRLAYLLHDMMVRVTEQRAALISRSGPTG